MGMEGVGARVARKEDKRFITGSGRYTDDMSVPGMKYAAFVRSPHAHAKIASIDTAAAEGMPGVIGVLTGKQLKAAVPELGEAQRSDGQGRRVRMYTGIALGIDSFV